MLKSRIKWRAAVPYGGRYRLNLPQRGMVGEANTFDALSAKVIAYRRANGIEVGVGFDVELQEALCLQYPQECVDVDPRVPAGGLSITSEDIVAATKVMLKQGMAGCPLVSREEANRRAAICANCQFQRSIRGTCQGLCGALKEMVQAVLGTQTTDHDGQLRSCGICHCFNAITVWLPLDVQWNVLSPERQAQFEYAQQVTGCWKHPTPQ